MQEEVSIFWVVTVSVILRKQVNMKACLILNGCPDTCGPASVVGIATGYGLEGMGVEFQ